jgi:SPOR domain
LKNKLIGKGYKVFTSESHQGDKGTWYRVCAGRKLDQEEARKLSGKLDRCKKPVFLVKTARQGPQRVTLSVLRVVFPLDKTARTG